MAGGTARSIGALNMDDRARGRARTFIYATRLLDAMGVGIIQPTVPALVMSLGHVGLADATRIGGWLTVVYACIQFLTGPLIGNLGDRFGRRAVLLCALAGLSCDYMLLALAPTLAWLFVGRAMAGLFGATNGPSAAAIADLTEPADRPRYFGMMSAAYATGFILGPSIGGLLGEIGLHVPFYVSAVLALCNLTFGAIALPETLSPEHRRPIEWRRANPVGAWRALRRLEGVLPLIIAGLLWNLAVTVFPTTWSYFATASFGWSSGQIGLSLALAGVLIAFSQFFVVGRVVAKIGAHRAAVMGISIGIVQLVCLSQVHYGWQAVAAMCLIFSHAFVGASINGMASRAVAANAQGELQGFQGSLLAVAAIVAPACYTPVIAYFISPAAPFRFPGVGFLMATVVASAALVMLIVIGKRERAVEAVA